ncbi:hypothetical protein MAR_023781 [Mya arenaria]|uniref:Uncharacterized protein n=1 Tax=Mya arenaria TaxID=6604 RepID=A0ABY7DQM6_MYAAR|nr:hypothetical protein MAR_023781 [Mya arenaria]
MSVAMDIEKEVVDFLLMEKADAQKVQNMCSQSVHHLTPIPEPIQNLRVTIKHSGIRRLYKRGPVITVILLQKTEVKGPRSSYSVNTSRSNLFKLEFFDLNLSTVRLYFKVLFVVPLNISLELDIIIVIVSDTDTLPILPAVTQQFTMIVYNYSQLDFALITEVQSPGAGIYSIPIVNSHAYRQKSVSTVHVNPSTCDDHRFIILVKTARSKHKVKNKSRTTVTARCALFDLQQPQRLVNQDLMQNFCCMLDCVLAMAVRPDTYRISQLTTPDMGRNNSRDIVELLIDGWNCVDELLDSAECKEL